ncbi:hypothetical protein M432DRAFT_549342 [Thermoascus aurantiacus ATCC 26904]
MSRVAEFIYFRLKPNVKPEEPGNREGELFIDTLRATKLQSGYEDSAWGRTVEDENDAVWVVEWGDARGAARASILAPFLEPSTEAVAFYTTLSPPISTTATLTDNPVTELVGLAFPTSITPEHKELNKDITNFRKTLMEKLPDNARPKSWSMGHVDRPGSVPHPNSPSGQVLVQFLAVGWESVDAHKAARETPEFNEAIKPIREKMLPPPKGLEMRHVSFTKI